MLESGVQKTVTEPYLVDALSFTEAEARIIEEMKPFISGEFTVSDIKRVKFSESFFNETGDRYYKAKLYFITLDEKSGSEKKTAINMLVQASELKEAVEIVESEMKKTMIDYSFAAVTETAIMDVYQYEKTTSSTTE
jgi:chlorite dismutase